MRNSHVTYPPPRRAGALRALALCGALVIPAIAGGLLAAPAHAVDADAIEGWKVIFTVNKPNFGSYNVVYSGGVRYSYKTQDITAEAGDDYKAVSGRLTFPAGTSVTAKEIKVETYEDQIDEGDGETFRLKLTDPQISNKACHCWVSAPEGLVPSQIVQTGEILEQ